MKYTLIIKFLAFSMRKMYLGKTLINHKKIATLNFEYFIKKQLQSIKICKHLHLLILKLMLYFKGIYLSRSFYMHILFCVFFCITYTKNNNNLSKLFYSGKI